MRSTSASTVGLPFIDAFINSPNKVFRVSYVGKGGKGEHRFIKASSEAEALALLGINRTRISSIRRDWYREIDDKLPKGAPSLTTQARILAVFSAQVQAGANPSTTLDRLLRHYKEFERQLPDVVRVMKVSEKLAVLKFNPQLQLLAEVGEESGLIGEVLGNAADELIERQKMVNTMRGKIIPGILIAVVGILVMLALPIFMVDPIEQLAGARGMQMKTNICTDFLMVLGRTFSQPIAWMAMLAGLIMLYVFRRHWWEPISGVPGLHLLRDFFRLQNSYAFVSAFVPLFKRGVPLTKTFTMLRRFAKGQATTTYAMMDAHMASGGSLGTSFESDYWDTMLRDCMRGFDSMRQDSKLDLLNRIQPLMGAQMLKSGENIGGVLGALGLFISVAVVVIVFLGLTLPLMTITSTF